MGKRNALVVLSSDEEVDRSSRRRCRKSKLSSTVPRTNPRRSKKARVSGPASGLPKESSNWDEVLRVI